MCVNLSLLQLRFFGGRYEDPNKCHLPLLSPIPRTVSLELSLNCRPNTDRGERGRDRPIPPNQINIFIHRERCPHTVILHLFPFPPPPFYVLPSRPRLVTFAVERIANGALGGGGVSIDFFTYWRTEVRKNRVRNSLPFFNTFSFLHKSFSLTPMRRQNF